MYLLHKFGRDMREQGHGRILITGSVEGYIPGTEQALYNATKAFLNSFAIALRHELMGSGITVTCLLPGATDTEIFARGRVKDTLLGQGPKSDALAVALTGFDAMMGRRERRAWSLEQDHKRDVGTFPPGNRRADARASGGAFASLNGDRGRLQIAFLLLFSRSLLIVFFGFSRFFFRLS